MEELETIIKDFFCSHCQTKNRVTVLHRVVLMSMHDRYQIFRCTGAVGTTTVEVIEPTPEEKQAIENTEKLKREKEEEQLHKMDNYKGWKRLCIESCYALWRQDGIETEYTHEINRAELEASKSFSLRCCQATVLVRVVEVDDEALTIEWDGRTDVITMSSGARMHIESCAYDCHGWLYLNIKT